MLDLIFAKSASIRLSEGRESGHEFWVLEMGGTHKVGKCLEKMCTVISLVFLDFTSTFCYTFLKNQFSDFESTEN